MISDSRIDPKIENLVTAEWGGKAIYASLTANARGCAIFFRKDLVCEIKSDSTHSDASGNFLLTQIVYDDKLITLCCIYGPKESPDNINFYRGTVFQKMADTDSDFLICGGD